MTAAPGAIYVLNGPNLNLLGEREPEIYGFATLADIEAACRSRAARRGLEVEFRQTNHEGALVDWVQEAARVGAGIAINAAGLSYGSVPLIDAVRFAPCPTVEVHLSNIHAREAFRRTSDLSPFVRGVIAGFGAHGYVLAIDALARIVEESQVDAEAG